MSKSTPTSTIEAWLDQVAGQDEVKGVLLADANTGLSLGVRGVAKNDDAPYLKWYCDTSMNGEDAGKVEYRGYEVYLKIDGQALIGVYKSLENDEDRTKLSFEGT